MNVNVIHHVLLKLLQLPGTDLLLKPEIDHFTYYLLLGPFFPLFFAFLRSVDHPQIPLIDLKGDVGQLVFSGNYFLLKMV